MNFVTLLSSFARTNIPSHNESKKVRVMYIYAGVFHICVFDPMNSAEETRLDSCELIFTIAL